MKSFFESLGLALLAVFAPVKTTLLTVLALVIADMITGIWASAKAKKPITSSGLKRTVIKLCVYEAALCLAFLVHQYLTGDTFPADKVVAAMIGMVELKSCLENLEAITGEPLLKSIIAKVDSQETPPQ